MMSERGGKLKRARKARDSAVGNLSLTATTRIRTAHLFSFFSVSAPCRHPFQTCIILLMNHSPGTQKANMAHFPRLMEYYRLLQLSLERQGHKFGLGCDSDSDFPSQ